MLTLGQNLNKAHLTQDIKKCNYGIDLCPFSLGFDKDYAPIYGIHGWLVE